MLLGLLLSPHLIMGFFGLINIVQYNNHDPSCHKSLFDWILAASIIDICTTILIFVVGLYILKKLKKNDENTIIVMDPILLLISQSILLIPGIWSLYTYYNSENSCREFLLNHVSAFWTFIAVHIALLYAGITIICIVAFCMCWFWMCTKLDP